MNKPVYFSVLGSKDKQGVSMILLCKWTSIALNRDDTHQAKKWFLWEERRGSWEL